MKTTLSNLRLGCLQLSSISISVLVNNTASAEDETFVTFDIFVLFCLEIIIKMFIPFILLASFTLTANGHAIHQDTRCNCICPDPSVTQAESISAAENLPNDFVPREIGDRRSIYINSTVSPGLLCYKLQRKIWHTLKYISNFHCLFFFFFFL